MIVRPLEPEDAAAVGAVRDASWRAAYGPLLPDGVLDDLDGAAWADRVMQHPATSTTRALVTEADGVITGYAFFGPGRDDDLDAVSEIYSIYAHPDHWSAGVGRALIAAAIESLGGPPVTLWVLAENQRARRFYERAGFVVDGAAKPADMPGGTQLPEVRYRLG